MGEIVELPADGREPPIEAYAATIMQLARKKSGLSRQQMAAAINRRSQRNPGLTAWSIAAYETGAALPVVDTFWHALILGGVDIAERLTNIFGTWDPSLPLLT